MGKVPESCLIILVILSELSLKSLTRFVCKRLSRRLSYPDVSIVARNLLKRLSSQKDPPQCALANYTAAFARVNGQDQTVPICITLCITVPSEAVAGSFCSASVAARLRAVLHPRFLRHLRLRRVPIR
jgi:hypothetical protein